MARVNYLLAACAHRVNRVDAPLPGKEILRAHLHELAKTNTQDLAQITILRALPLVRNANFLGESNYYWDVSGSRDAFRCPVEILDIQDHCFSYSSWVQAVVRWRAAFDYYILMEDDYYPSHPQFVERLIFEHTRKLPRGGFLCGFATDHAASSNGIVDSATVVQCIDALADPVSAAGGGQREFARVFCADRIADYTDRYRSLFKSNDVVELAHTNAGGRCYPTPTEDLIRPIEYLLTGERPFPFAGLRWTT